MENLVFESLDELFEAKKKKKNWIGPMFKAAKKKGTEGRCSGSKFGGPSCPAGSKQYNAAKNLRKIAKGNKKSK
jgi:hypothetical protein